MLTRTLRPARSLALGLLAAVALSGCFENDFLTPYEGPTVVEFEQVAGRYTRTVNEGAGNVEIQVNLIGPQQSSDTQINVDVVGGSTAAEGTHYSFPNGRSVTIPANSSSGMLTINVPVGPLAGPVRNDQGVIIRPAETATLRLELAGTPDGSIEGAENFDDFVLTIVGV